MKVTANITLMKDQTKNLKAFANLTFNEAFVVTNLRVMDGKKGLWVAMPSVKIGEVWKDTAYPITKPARDRISEIVLEAYNEKVVGDVTDKLDGEAFTPTNKSVDEAIDNSDSDNSVPF